MTQYSHSRLASFENCPKRFEYRYVQKLEVDTEGISPTSHAIPLATPLREDRGEPSLDPEVALANAPERAGSAFVVPKVIEAEQEG